MTPPGAPDTPSTTPNAWQWAGLLGILAVACARLAILFAPQLVWDVDPARNPNPLPGFGPDASLRLDLVLLLAIAAALIGERRARRPFDRTLILLALAPWPVILWHGWHDLGDLWRGTTWGCGALAAVALAHLARVRTLRIAAISILLAALVPLAARAVAQLPVEDMGVVGVEYAAAVEEFEANKDAFLADRGWTPDDPAARIFERRVRAANVRGWFPTTNILATLAGFGAVLAACLAAGARRRPALAAGTLALAAIFAALVGLSAAKGGIAAALAGAALAGVGMIFARVGMAPARRARTLATLALLGVVGAIAGVIVRGALLPEAFAGDLSLLFRWHYLDAAARIFLDHPFLGVGPDGFQAAYTQARPPRNPEEVMSAHNAFADWLATLGVLGAAWIGLTALLLWRTACAHENEATLDDAEVDACARPVATAAAVIGVLAFGGAMVVEAANLTIGETALRIVGIVGFVGAAALLAHVVARLDGPVLRRALIAAGAVVLVHAMIEMTFFQPGAVIWCFAVLGMGAAVRTPSRSHRIGSAVVAATPLALAVVLLAPVILASRNAAVYRAVAVRLYDNAQTGDVIGARRRAGDALADLADAWPPFHPPALAATRQRLLAGAADATTLADAQRWAERWNRGDLWSIASRAAEAAGDLDAARAAAERLVDLDPRGVASWRRLGDVLWLRGDQEAARAAYATALANDDAFELDPLKQLAPAERARLEQP